MWGAGGELWRPACKLCLPVGVVTLAPAPYRQQYVLPECQLVTCMVCSLYLLQETELRTLKIAAEDIATKFDAAVAALATKRLDVLAEVSAAHTCPGCFRRTNAC